VDIWVCMFCAELHWGQTSLHALIVPATTAANTSLHYAVGFESLACKRMYGICMHTGFAAVAAVHTASACSSCALQATLSLDAPLHVLRRCYNLTHERLVVRTCQF
jgi:hypothetical protein